MPPPPLLVDQAAALLLFFAYHTVGMIDGDAASVFDTNGERPSAQVLIGGGLLALAAGYALKCLFQVYLLLADMLKVPALICGDAMRDAAEARVEKAAKCGHL